MALRALKQNQGSTKGDPESWLKLRTRMSLTAMMSVSSGVVHKFTRVLLAAVTAAMRILYTSLGSKPNLGVQVTV